MKQQTIGGEHIDSGTDTEKQASMNLLVRVVTALVLTPVALFLLAQGGWWFVVPFLFFSFLGTTEADFMITHRHMTWIVRVLGVVSAMITFGMIALLEIPAVALLSTLIPLFVAGLIMASPHGKPLKLPEPVSMVLVMLYVALICALAIGVRNHPYGLALWFLIVTGTWAMDTFSYLGGRVFGRHKLVPRISPKKTIEGAIAGVVGTIALNLGFLLFFNAWTPIVILLVIGTPFVALVGDLVMSKLKRMYQVKDSFVPGLNIIPGHGGLLDRIDSTLLVVVFFYAVLQLTF